MLSVTAANKPGALSVSTRNHHVRQRLGVKLLLSTYISTPPNASTPTPAGSLNSSHASQYKPAKPTPASFAPRASRLLAPPPAIPNGQAPLPLLPLAVRGGQPHDHAPLQRPASARRPAPRVLPPRRSSVAVSASGAVRQRCGLRRRPRPPSCPRHAGVPVAEELPLARHRGQRLRRGRRAPPQDRRAAPGAASLAPAPPPPPGAPPPALRELVLRRQRVVQLRRRGPGVRVRVGDAGDHDVVHHHHRDAVLVGWRERGREPGGGGRTAGGGRLRGGEALR
jgi:hypothetical protein